MNQKAEEYLKLAEKLAEETRERLDTWEEVDRHGQVVESHERDMRRIAAGQLFATIALCYREVPKPADALDYQSKGEP